MLAYLGVSLRAAELRQHAVVDRPVRTGCDAFADGSLMMIIAACDHFPGAYLAMWEGPGEGQGPEIEWDDHVTDEVYRA